MNTEILMQVATQYAESMTRAALEDERCNEELAAQHHAQKREAHDKLQAMIYQLMAPNITDDDADLLAQAVRQLEEFSAQALTHGNSSEHHAAACSAHAVQKLAVALMSAQRCTKALVQIAEPAEDIWPCINIDVDEHGAITNAKLYSPGLPAGNHDVYPVRVPYMDEHTEAWLTCVKELERFDSSFLNREGMNGLECAASVIRELVSRAQRAAAPQAVQAAVPSDAASDLKNALADAIELRQQLRLMEEHARGDVWRWQADAENELASMGNRMGVLILASDLRNLLAAPAHPAEGVPAPDAEEKIGSLLALARNMVRSALDADNKTEVQEIKAAIEAEVNFERGLRAALAATQPAAQTTPPTREGVIQHLTIAGVLEHDGCGVFIASGDASELINACVALTAAQPAAQGMDAQNLYYLQDARHHAMVGNCPSWWRPDSNGYTTNLDEAERFTFEEAMKQHKCRKTDLPWLCTEIDKLRRPTVDCQYMPRSWDAQRAALAAQAKQGGA